MYKIVQSSRLYEQIVEQIEQSVQRGDLKPGDQLPAERELAEQFGVSRTAVREAVKALREKGLVEAYPGKGTFITSARPLSPTNVTLGPISSRIGFSFSNVSLLPPTITDNLPS